MQRIERAGLFRTTALASLVLVTACSGGTSGGGRATGGSPAPASTGGSGGSPGTPTGGAGPADASGPTGGGTGGAAPADAAAFDARAGSPDASMAGADAAGVRSNRILFYTKTSGTTHVAGIAAAVGELTKLLGPEGLASDMSADPAVFTAANLAKYAGVVMVSTSGAPFGTPGTTQMEALVSFVRAGGGLAAFHAASNTDYGDTSPFAMLLGGAMKDQGGGFRTSNCFPQMTDQPAVAKLPTPYMVMNEEFYTFNNLSPSNQVVLLCAPNTGTDRIPISWVRQEGSGRVFYSGLGHYAALWATQFITDHAWPGILWSIGR